MLSPKMMATPSGRQKSALSAPPRMQRAPVRNRSPLPGAGCRTLSWSQSGETGRRRVSRPDKRILKAQALHSEVFHEIQKDNRVLHDNACKRDHPHSSHQHAERVNVTRSPIRTPMSERITDSMITNGTRMELNSLTSTRTQHQCYEERLLQECRRVVRSSFRPVYFSV